MIYVGGKQSGGVSWETGGGGGGSCGKGMPQSKIAQMH